MIIAIACGLITVISTLILIIKIKSDKLSYDVTVPYKVKKVIHLFFIWYIMNTIYKGLCLLSCPFWRSTRSTLATCSDKLSDSPVCEKHELLDEPVCFLCNLLIDIYRLTFFIHLYLHFRAVKADGSGSKPLLAKL